MPDSSLIVPTILTTGTLRFVSVKPDGTAQNVINSLVALDEVNSEILGDLDEAGWALQKVRWEENGRTWENDELQAIGDDIVLSSTPVVQILDTAPWSPARPLMARNSSAFPLTSHLHTPAVRLVSLHPLLSLTFAFFRVPQIHDGFEWSLFISRSTTVKDVIETVIDELGLSRNFPVLGGGKGGSFEYVLEEVWTEEGGAEESSRLPPSTLISKIIESPFVSNPFCSSARRGFRFCIPDEWFRRSKTRPTTSTPLESSETTLKRLAASEEDKSTDEDEEGTAKQQKVVQAPRPHNDERDSPDWRSSLSQRRLSNLFDSLLGNPSSVSPKRASAISAPECVNVSEPTLMDHHTGSSGAGNGCGDSEESETEPDSIEFEKMLNEMGLKGAQREAMYKLDPARKRFILRQNRDFQSNISISKASTSRSSGHPVTQPIFGPSNATPILPLVPQLTGGFMRRFSIAGWGAAVSDHEKHSSGEFNTSNGNSNKGNAEAERVAEPIGPLQPQGTGGLWSGWWSLSGGAVGDKDPNQDTSQTVRWYVDGIRGGKVTDTKLVKHLISLRVHLSTAKLIWIKEFSVEEHGMDALATLLAGLVGKGGKRKKLTDVEGTVLLEIIKCLRVLLNTELGFNQVLSSPTITTHIAYSLHTSSMRLRTLASELLAAICVLSVPQGHKAVLGAMSDYQVAYEESFRFESLIISLGSSDIELAGASENENYSGDEEGVWEGRAASMALVNALTNCPESLEERILLRDEFGRRGLNEIIVALRYIKPPDRFLTQLDVYTEEKFQDEADMREYVRNLVNGAFGHPRTRSDSEIVLEDLIRLAKQHGELYPMMVEILKRYEVLLQRDVGTQLKADLLTILDRFAEQAALLNNFDDSWHLFMMRFTNSVQHITGQELEVRAVSDSNSMTVVEQEMEALRTKVDELSDERAELRQQLNQQIAEMNTYKSLPLNLPVPHSNTSCKGGNENFHGLVQRLVQKEKQVLHLQTELDRFNAQNPAEGRDADERAKRDRDRAKWNTLMDEIAKLKVMNGELEVSIGIKEKEILYLKRALESVYSRFQSREENREPDFDAQLIASRTIERLTQKEDEIFALTSLVTDLKIQLAAMPTTITEKDFKARTVPPPPPVKPKRTTTPSASSGELSETPTCTLPLSLPPPPPPLHPAPPSVASATPLSPPPPPPPPPPSLSPASMGSTPPPPPPPHSAFKGSRPKMSRPTKRLKPFFWTKVTKRTCPRLMEDLEATFTVDNTSGSAQALMNPTKKAVTTLLDVSRANNIAIMLSRIKLGYPEIRKALLDMDDQILSIDDLMAISRQLPTSEEVGRIKDFEDVSKLANADQYFSQIAIIPRLSERLECTIYRRKLDLEIEEIRPELNILRNASREVRHSNRFKQVLQAILAVGNALNGSTFRGEARGFQLEALLKMKEMKTVKGGPECPTLLHYLARVLLRTDPLLVTFIEDLPHLEAAARVSMQIIMQSVNSLVAGLQQLNEEIRQLRQLRTLPVGDQFIHVMQPFTVQASGRVDALKKMGISLESEVRSLLVYYGERPDSLEGNKPEDFFTLILSFSSALQKSAVEVHDAVDKSPTSKIISPAKEEETASEPTIKGGQEPSSQPLLSPPTDSQGRAGGQQTVKRGDLDQAIRSMRDGKRRTRPNRPLSKIFLDGGRPSTRVFD